MFMRTAPLVWALLVALPAGADKLELVDGDILHR